MVTETQYDIERDSYIKYISDDIVYAFGHIFNCQKFDHFNIKSRRWNVSNMMNIRNKLWYFRNGTDEYINKLNKW